MAYRKATLRSMSPVTRKVARLIGEQDSIARRLKNLIPELQRLELDSRALAAGQRIKAEKTDKCYSCQYHQATQDGGYECDPPMGECPLDRPEL